MTHYFASPLIDQFNAACHAVADDFAMLIEKTIVTEGVAANKVAIMPLDGSIPDLDEWWAIEDNGKTFFDRHTDNLSKLSKEDLLTLRETALDDMSNRWAGDDPLRHSLLTGFHTMLLQSSSSSQTVLNTLLPHQPDYAIPTFNKLDGCQRLKKLCGCDIELDFFVEVHPQAEKLNAPNAYRLVMYFTIDPEIAEHTNLLSLAKTRSEQAPKRRFN